jgi:hypothetical protein
MNWNSVIDLFAWIGFAAAMFGAFGWWHTRELFRK